ncbi:hypothetical protein HYALB_00011975 [Hymenoscyphus albidus]|uniref:Uncharacterized protein n=1 Tax=Hymenoscyphus albidus TaxID=595503 RepID=A0A9N9LJJ9_9HELO|nr:hypothetical protein HYALB_00011975 [Hymenoscyphus albidus]
MDEYNGCKYYPVVVIGAGASGIAMGHNLKHKLRLDQFVGPGGLINIQEISIRRQTAIVHASEAASNLPLHRLGHPSISTSLIDHKLPP